MLTRRATATTRPSEMGLLSSLPSKFSLSLIDFTAWKRWKSMVLVSAHTASELCMAAIMAMKACVAALSS